MNISRFEVILPVGISFYTFQALSYTVDVYRDEIYAEKNFFRYALFVSFFPQLVAGPIERSKSLLKQLSMSCDFDFERVREGFLLMVWGYFLKIVIAERIAIFVDTIYGNYEQYPGVYLVVATILFGFQIYCDFAGYSTIAMGTAMIFGIFLVENFDAPYLSKTVAEFWRKWHMSLTSWFRDYLYIPLGGGRKGKFRKLFNILIVFLVSGLWHGASVNFIVWGGINGLYQIIEELIIPIRNVTNRLLRINVESKRYNFLRIVWTFIFIDFSWIFFRSKSINEAVAIIKSIIALGNLNVLFDGSLFNCGLDVQNFTIVLFGILILVIADVCKKNGIIVRRKIIDQNLMLRCLIIALSISAVLLFGKYGPSFNVKNFIYFQF